MSNRTRLNNRRFCETFDLRHGNVSFKVSVGYFETSRIGEVFVTGAKAGSDLDATARDGAVLLSLALQYGVPLDVIAAALSREADGGPSTIIGAVVDQLVEGS